MVRFCISFLLILLFFTGLTAQNSNVPAKRLIVQDLNPEEALLHKERNEVESFTRKLGALKTAFAEKDASRIVAYEAHILRGMRNETDQLTLKASTSEATATTKIRLESMNLTLAAFEAHAFDPSKPEIAARDFAKLDEFLKLMLQELAEVSSDK